MQPAKDLKTSGREQTESLVVVQVGGRKFALRTRDVLEVHPMVLVSPLPHAPLGVEGVIEARGDVVAVLDLAPRFGGPAGSDQLDDMLVLISTARRRLALHVDHDVAVRTIAVRDLDAVVQADAPYAVGLAVLPDDVVVVHDIDAFLSSDEEAALSAALRRQDRAAT